jgi:hypothetical protein
MENNNYRRRRGFFRQKYRRDRDRRPTDGQSDKQYPEISSAIAYKTTNEPAHIECIIEDIKKSETLEQNERICYLGKGSFGIVVAKNSSGPIKFSIRKRIQYEASNIPVEWRKRIR